MVVSNKTHKGAIVTNYFAVARTHIFFCPRNPFYCTIS